MVHSALRSQYRGTDWRGCSIGTAIARLGSVRAAVTGTEICLFERRAVSSRLIDASRLIRPALGESGTRRTGQLRMCLRSWSGHGCNRRDVPGPPSEIDY